MIAYPQSGLEETTSYMVSGDGARSLSIDEDGHRAKGDPEGDVGGLIADHEHRRRRDAKLI